jgi:hypothetical protein
MQYGNKMRGSMEVSIFLAKLLGLYFLVFSILCLFRKRQVETAAKDMAASKGILAVSAEISLIFGLVIVIDHSIWEYSWRGLITLIGYLMILKAVLRFAFPNTVKKMISKIMGSGYWVTLIIMIVIGAYLTYCGFTYPQNY